MKPSLAALLTKKYGPVEPIRLTGGFTNATYLLHGTNPALVAKVANLSNLDIENESRALLFLKDSTHTPRIVDMVSEKGSRIVITQFLEGENGQAVLDTGDVHRSENLFKEMGRCLADGVHARLYEGNRQNLRLGNLYGSSDSLDFAPRALLMGCHEVLDRLDAPLEEWVLTHGDFGAHNVLVKSGRPLTVIDWEWAEWFHPLVDLAWVCWNTKLHYPAIADRLNHAFLQSYQSRKPINFEADTLKAFALYKLRNILFRMQNADRQTQEKWIHRLEWTLNSEIL